jgi:hypothetical protein
LRDGTPAVIATELDGVGSGVFWYAGVRTLEWRRPGIP